MDRPGVVTVKHRLLARSGAELPQDSQDGGAPRFPLLAASYAAVAGDLADGTWASELRAAGGFIPSLNLFQTVLPNARGEVSLLHRTVLRTQTWLFCQAVHSGYHGPLALCFCQELGTIGIAVG